MKNIFFLGTVFSGSTILGDCLDTHPLISYAGEVDRLVHNPESIVPKFPNPTCLECDINSTSCKVWNEDVLEIFKNIDSHNIHKELSRVLNSDIVIDGSKHPHWIRRLISTESIDVENTKIIITARNPMAFGESLKRRTGQQTWVGANIWRDVYYDSIRTATLNNIPFLVIRYEDFCLNTSSVLKSICNFIGVDYSSKMLNFQKIQHHNIGGNWNAKSGNLQYENNSELFGNRIIGLNRMDHNVAKGSSVYWGKKFGGWVDDKWKKLLTDDEKKLILNSPSINDISNLLGYNIYNILN